MKLKFDFNKIIGYFNLDSEKGLFINSFRDWKVLLACSSLFLIVVFGVDVYMLLSVKGKIDLVAQGTKNAKESKLNEAALESALKEIDMRAENFRRIYTSVVVSAPTATTTPVR